MNRYLVNIQALRGVAASLVVLSHLGVVEAKYGGDTILPGETILGFSGVDLFFVISGFIMVHVTRGDFGAPRKAGAFLFSRFTRIYPLYWLVSLFLIVVWLRWPDMVFASATGSPDLIKSLALWPESRPPLLAVSTSSQLRVVGPHSPPRAKWRRSRGVRAKRWPAVGGSCCSAVQWQFRGRR